jgi:hypothetical protein
MTNMRVLVDDAVEPPWFSPLEIRYPSVED